MGPYEGWIMVVLWVFIKCVSNIVWVDVNGKMLSSWLSLGEI